MTDTLKEFGRLLKENRKALGLTQHELAKRLKISQASLSRIERGEQDPGIVGADAIAKALSKVSAASPTPQC